MEGYTTDLSGALNNAIDERLKSHIDSWVILKIDEDVPKSVSLQINKQLPTLVSDLALDLPIISNIFDKVGSMVINHEKKVSDVLQKCEDDTGNKINQFNLDFENLVEISKNNIKEKLRETTDILLEQSVIEIEENAEQVLNQVTHSYIHKIEQKYEDRISDLKSENSALRFEIAELSQTVNKIANKGYDYNARIYKIQEDMRKNNDNFMVWGVGLSVVTGLILINLILPERNDF